MTTSNKEYLGNTRQGVVAGKYGIIKIAWRNLWRNKRRTLITVSSIFFGVIFSALMGSMQEGSYQKMIENVVKFYAGHAQIQQKEFPDHQTINNSFVPSDSLLEKLRKHPQIEMVVPRLESFALASSGNQTEGVLVLGIDPGKEDRMTGLANKVVSGTYLDKNGALVGADLADNLGLEVGDTLVMISQGFHGVSAFGQYQVEGIIQHPNPELNRRLVYLPLNGLNIFSRLLVVLLPWL